MSAASELEKIAKEVAVCTKCPLCKTRTRTVPGEGSPQSRLLFIGEAPGYHEDREGRPFVGPSGQLLNKLLNAIKISRQDVFIANVVKCRPPNNADPTPDQIAACKPYLDRQVAAINPPVIVTLGRFSMARYWPGQLISRIHGQPKIENGRVHLPMFHPAAALRDVGRTLPMFKEDGLTIPALLEQAEELARTELWGQTAEARPEADEPDLSQPVLAATTAGPGVSRAARAALLAVKEPAAPTYVVPSLAPPEVPVVPPTEAIPPVVSLSPVALETEPPVLSNLVSEAIVGAASDAPPKPTRGRKPKVEAGSPAPPKPARITSPRKKRVPAHGEQLRLF